MNNTQNIFFQTLFFMMSPFYYLIMSLKKIKSTQAKNAVWFFVFFFGVTMVIKSEGLDSYFYLSELRSMHDSKINFLEFLSGFYVSNSGIDIFQPLLTYFISVFTDSQKVLFGVFALIFGYFYSRSIWIVIIKINSTVTFLLFVLVLSLFFIVPFWSINGVRFWTATMVYFYFLIDYLLNKKIRWFVVLVPLIHFSFLLPVGLSLLYYFLGNRTFIYFVLFFLTMFISDIDLSVLNEFLNENSSNIFAKRVSGYADESYAESVNLLTSENNWYAQFMGKGLLWFVRISITLMYLNQLITFKKINNLSLLSFTFLFGFFANIVGNIPSGGRFLTVFNLFGMSYLILNYYGFKYRNILYLGLPNLIIFIVVSIRIGFDFMNVISVFGNPILMLIDDNSTALIDFIK